MRRFYHATLDELLAKARDGRPSLLDDYKPCLHSFAYGLKREYKRRDSGGQLG